MTEEIAQTNIGCIEAHLPDTNNKDEHCLTDSKTLVNESLKFESSVTKEQQKTLAENSARIIQRAWRRHIDTQLFKHYKNMINFRGQGNPRFMMKCINPIEAGLLDSAAGVHVRFRLGGYLGTTVDYMEFEPNRKRTTFHHCTLQRKQDAKRKQKQKKIEWMKKMYQDGILQAQTLNPNTAVLVQRATEGLIDSVEQKGPNSILDWEVDELLEWTNALNFEKYLNDWTEIACSSSSANLPGSRSHFVENDLYKQVRLCVMNTYAAMQDAAQYTI
ncbi:protein MFI isoform X5 [Hemiscyllium ocellatum]|uniref:protein MFI isoform X5 n=1 Tax=Hemiscyllium ocellatum TaxID=170820 RepID=UPI002966B7D8|nr:protein MFI isoform X5 [Hemiscyllium ocellatum]